MLRGLVVDDDVELVKQTLEFFQLSGWEMEAAYNGQEALDKLDPSFDAVVLDLQMPVKNGEQTLQEIRKRYELDGVCIVLLTGYPTIPSAVRSMRLGASRYLLKPFDLEELRKILVVGIAQQKIRALRRELLGTLDLDSFLEQISTLLCNTVIPEGPYLVFLDHSGAIHSVRRSGAIVAPTELEKLKAGGDRRFVREILKYERPVFVGNGDRVADWDPILSNARSLFATPIPAAEGGVAGIIDLESTQEGTFDASWEEVLVSLADMAGIALEIAEKSRRNAELSAKAARAEAEANLRTERETREKMIQLTRELGHRLLTPIQVITFEADTMVGKDLSAPVFETLPVRVRANLRRRVEVIRTSASEVAGVCQYLRDVSREVPVDLRSVPVLDIVTSCFEMHLSELKSKRVALNIPDDRFRKVIVRADLGLLKYSLECLIRNAIEAIEEAREKRAATVKGKRLRNVQDDSITVGLSVDHGAKLAAISVSDTGCGVPDKYRARLFVALFTSKQRPYPSGTGLFSVNHYMVLQGGSIELEPSSGSGATFVLKLPLAQQ